MSYNGQNSTTFKEKAKLPLLVLQLPFVMTYNVLISPWSERNKKKPLKRVMFDSALRFVSSNTTIKQMQALGDSTHMSYRKWCKSANMSPVVDELGDGARLLWIGPRRMDRVVLYCHGGGFVGALGDFQATFWKRVQDELAHKQNRQKIGVAVLEYSLSPATFPTQLNQLMLAMRHILSKGVLPSNIYLAGDSAGANIIYQLISHTLHPVSGVSASPLSKEESKSLAGLIMISPWTSLAGIRPSDVADGHLDIMTAETLGYWGRSYLSNIPKSQHVYVQPSFSTTSWLSGVDKLFDRVFITAGSSEAMRDDIVAFSETFERVHPDVEFLVQQDGIHNEPMFEHGVKLKNLSHVTEAIIDWLAEEDGTTDSKRET